MLYAELHHKFSFEALDFERSEDILTSTVFGTLLHSEGGKEILRHWLTRARFGPGNFRLVVPNELPEYRFWPRLEGCIPPRRISN